MAKVRTGDIKVAGLAELGKVLRSMDTDLANQLKEANRDAARLVATAATSKALSIGGAAAKTAPSIRAVGGARSAGVSFGGAAYPFAGGAEFGANRDSQRRRRSGTYIGYRQFDTWRGSGGYAGYFVYPSIRANEDRIVAQYQDALDDLIRRSFPD